MVPYGLREQTFKIWKTKWPLRFEKTKWSLSKNTTAYWFLINLFLLYLLEAVLGGKGFFVVFWATSLGVIVLLSVLFSATTAEK